jgi:hypothetical protein
MNTIIKNQPTIVTIDDYINSISIKYEKNINNTEPKNKINKNKKDSETNVPTIHNYNEMTRYNYNVQQLKSFAKLYKLKITGNKSQLISRIYIFLHLSKYAIKIQKIFRGILQRKFNNLQGPALKNKRLCTNNTDFITMDELIYLHPDQFFSYRDIDGFIYGFDLASIYHLIFKTDNGNDKNNKNNKSNSKNPYNRNIIPQSVLTNIKLFIKLSKILKKTNYLEIQEEPTNLSNEKILELRALSLFQNINALGNYSNSEWFLFLQRNQIIKFIRELIDIWNYRAQLTMEVKRKICPPNADPFRNLSISYIYSEQDMNNVKKVVLEVLEILVNNGIDTDSKSLGAYYVLAALTLVNEEAATALPWLFHSVSYF